MHKISILNYYFIFLVKLKMAEKLIGKWKCVSTENFDEFMKKLGVGFMARKVGASLKPNLTIEFDKNENKWLIRSETSVKTTTHSFLMNVEFEEEMVNGMIVKSVSSLSGNKMIHTQRDNDKVVCVITREVDNNDNQIVIFKAGDIEAKRVFKRA